MTTRALDDRELLLDLEEDVDGGEAVMIVCPIDTRALEDPELLVDLDEEEGGEDVTIVGLKRRRVREDIDVLEGEDGGYSS